MAYHGVLALLLAKGASPADCFKLSDDDQTLELIKTRRGRLELSAKLNKSIGDVDWQMFDRQVAMIEQHAVSVVSCMDANYPLYLRPLGQAPPLMFYKGNVADLVRRGIAIVGTRPATARGASFTRQLAGDLAAQGITIVSGAARGIDTAAHRGAIDVKGKTIAVVGTGLDLTFPKENQALIESLPKHGGVLSEQLMGTPGLRQNFPRRNRLISALSYAVIVVEAGERSGALITAEWALEQGRDIGAVPGFPGDARSRGTNQLIKKGAFMVEGARDVLEAVPLADPEAMATGRVVIPERGTEIGAAARVVLEALGVTPTDVDTLSHHLELPVAALQAILIDLEVKGVVARDLMGAYYRAL